jgi:hypothetical protein
MTANRATVTMRNGRIPTAGGFMVTLSIMVAPSVILVDVPGRSIEIGCVLGVSSKAHAYGDCA